MIESYIDPGLLILVPVLYIIGIGFKKMQRFNSAYLPIVLGVFGIILSAMYLFIDLQVDNIRDVIEYIFNSLVQGILAAGASVYFNQVKKQIQQNEIKSLFYKK